MKVPHAYNPRTRPTSQGIAGVDPGPMPFAGLGEGLARGMQGLSAGLTAAKERKGSLDRFGALREFSDFQTEMERQLTEMKRAAPPNGQGFAKQAEDFYEEQRQRFIGTRIPEELRPEFDFRTEQLKGNVVGDALKFQYDAGDAFFREGVNVEYQKALKRLDPRLGGDPARLEEERAYLADVVGTTDLSDIEKADLSNKLGIGLEGIAYRSAYVKQLAGGAINLDETVGAVIDTAAAKHGEDAKALRVIAWLESKGNPQAQNPNSSAGGLFQQTDGNARDYSVGDRFDAAQSAEGAARFMKDNRAALKKVLGREPTVGELYLAHQQGPAGAAKLLRNPNALAVDVVGYDEVRLNGGAPGMTAGQFANLWISKANAADPDLDNNPAFSNLPFEDRLNLQKDAEAEFIRDQTEQAAARKLRVDTQINELMNGINDGRLGQQAIDEARQGGWLTDYDQIKRAQDLYAKVNADAILMGRAQAKLGNQFAVWDPTNEEDQKMLNALVGKQGIAAIGGANQEYFTNGVIPLVTRANDIPTDVIGTLTGMVRSNNQTQSLFALDALSQLEDADPRAYAARVPEKLARDVDAWRANKDLVSTDQLMEVINGGRTQQERQTNKILEEEAKSYLASKESGVATLPSLVEGFVGEYNGWTWSAQQTTAPGFARALSLEYQDAFVMNYKASGGNKELADKLTRQQLGRTWGVSSVGGRGVVMKYPPEKVGYRPLGGDYAWIDAQVREELGLAEDAQFELVSDAQTESEFKKWQLGQGPAASYQVVTYDAEGVGRLARERRYFVPSEKTIQDETKAFERKGVEQKLMESIARRMEAENAGRLTGAGVPQELLDEEQQLQQQYDSLAPAAPAVVPAAPEPELGNTFMGAP